MPIKVDRLLASIYSSHPVPRFFFLWAILWSTFVKLVNLSNLSSPRESSTEKNITVLPGGCYAYGGKLFACTFLAYPRMLFYQLFT